MRAEFPEDDGGWRLQQDVCNEEEEDDNGVSVFDKNEVDTHASDDGNTGVGSIHKRDAVHEAQSQDQSSVNAVNDFPLLLGSELINGSIVVLFGLSGDVCVATFELVDVEGTLLHRRVLHGRVCRHLEADRGGYEVKKKGGRSLVRDEIEQEAEHDGGNA